VCCFGWGIPVAVIRYTKGLTERYTKGLNGASGVYTRRYAKGLTEAASKLTHMNVTTLRAASSVADRARAHPRSTMASERGQAWLGPVMSRIKLINASRGAGIQLRACRPNARSTSSKAMTSTWSTTPS